MSKWKDYSMSSRIWTLCKVYEAALDGVKPDRVDSRTMTPTFLMNLEKPQVVNLKDMTLVERIFYNKTPYTVHGMYVEDLFVSYVNFARPLQGYTAVHLGCEFCRHNFQPEFCYQIKTGSTWYLTSFPGKMFTFPSTPESQTRWLL